MLPLADETAALRSAGGNELKRFLFSAGLLVAVAGALLGLALNVYADGLATELKVEEKSTLAANISNR